MGDIAKVALANSTCAATIPLLGFGTAAFPFTASENTKEAVLHAIKLGCRHFDAAAIYNSEQPLGDAVAEALRDGVIKSRSELFITSKLWCKDGHPHRVLAALQKTLENLGMKYLDLYLIHFPVSLKWTDSNDLPFDKGDLLPMDFKGVWEAMEDCLKLGFTKHIGVSNFSIEKLQNLLSTAKIPPAVNQVEVNPLWHQKKLREFCEEKGIHITAYSPLGARGTPWGANEVLDCEVLKQIAQSRGKSVAQVCLRWVYEQGVSVLVKSFNKERMKENLEIFDWTLGSEELEIINQIQQRKSCRAEVYISEKGPFKSVQELWDMEIE